MHFFPLTAVLFLAACGTSQAAPGWQSLARIEIAKGHRPLALGFDESHTAYWLEARSGADEEAVGQIWSRVAEPGAKPEIVADGLPLKPGRSALFAWRGLCFLAAPPTIRIIDTNRKGGSAVAKTVDPVFTIDRGRGGAGFGGLSIAPDGRIYGSFSGGTVTGIEDAPGSQSAVFRFEPDGTGFEIVHRGLIEPSAPVFDEIGRGRLIDRMDAEAPGARVMPLLDSGFGGDGKVLSVEGIVLPEAAVGETSQSGGWIFTLAKPTPADPPALTWQAPDGSKEDKPAADAGSLVEGAQIIDLASDWNGVPHLLVSRPAAADAPGTIEILAFGEPGNRAQGADKLAEIRSHFDDPQQKDGTALSDLLNDPERRIRWQAAWAMSRRPDGLPLLEHVFGKGEPLSQHAALAAIGVIARRGAGATVPGDDLEFGTLPKDEFARQAAQKIAAWVTHPDATVRVHALQALCSARRPAGLIPFEKMLADRDQAVRDQTLLAAGRLRWRALVSSMRTARARGGGKLTTARLADALAGIHPPEQLPVYRQQGDRQLRLAAVEALRQYGHVALAHFVFDQDVEVAAAAVLAIDEGQLRDAFAAVARRLSQGSIDDWPSAARQAAQRCALRAEQ